MFRKDRVVIPGNTARFAKRLAQPFTKQNLLCAVRAIAPALFALTLSSVAHAQGTMDFSGAQTLMGTFKLFAGYAGDATFAPSHSSGLSVTITKTSVGAVLTATRKSVQPGQKVTFSISATGVTNGVVPTGTVIFTNATTGVVLGSEVLSATSSSTTTPISIAYVTVSASQLQLGVNTITASYSGDSNYIASSVASLTIDLSGSFITTINPASLTLTPNGTGSVAVTVTPNGTVLTQNSLTFACPATMPAGITCSFSPAIVGSSGAITSKLTLQLAAPLYVKPTSTASVRTRRGWLGAGFTGGLAGLVLLILPRRRRHHLLALSVIFCSSLLITVGCSGGGTGSREKNPPALIATTTTLSVSPTAPILGSPVVFTTKVAPSSGTGLPSGTITFSEGTTVLGTASLSSGSASLTISSLLVGSQAVTAAYGGDSTYSGSSSAVSTLDVAFNGTIAVTASDNAGDQSSANLSVTIE